MTAFFVLALIVLLAAWAAAATVAAIDAQDRYTDALVREDRLRRELYGEQVAS